jgi:hypothetical protein
MIIRIYGRKIPIRVHRQFRIESVYAGGVRVFRLKQNEFFADGIDLAGLRLRPARKLFGRIGFSFFRSFSNYLTYLVRDNKCS